MWRNVAIIGSGPAGWTAAIYAARANLQPILFEGAEPGGQLMTTTDVENYPGFPSGIQGPELMRLMKEQAARFGTEIVPAFVTAVRPIADGFAMTVEGAEVQTRTMILSMGATARRLGLESEKKYYGKGVSACATCDGFFFKNKKVIVVGGGDSAMEEATFLTRFADSVTIVHRRDTFRASKIMQERVRHNPKIHVVWNTEIVEILGDASRVTGVRVKDLTSGTDREMPIDGVFAAIGHEPNSSLVAGLITLDEKGYVVTQSDTSLTSVRGIFACGDLQDARYRQAVTAAGSGCMAALDAEKYLSDSLRV